MLLMLVYFSSAQLAQSQAVAPPALLIYCPYSMLLCKNRRLFTVAGDNSHVLTPIPMGIPWDPWDPSLPHSHAHLYPERDTFVCRPLDVPGSDHGSWLQVAEVQQDEVSTLTDVVNLDAGQHAAASESSKYGTGRTLTCRCDRQKAALPPSTCRHGPGAGSSTAHAAPPGTTQRYRDCCMVPHVDRGTHPESQAPLMTSEGLL